MPEYFRTTRRNRSKRGEWAEKLWEVQDSGAITRSVETDDYGDSKALSLRILAHKSSAFMDYSYGALNPCLMTNRYKSVDDFKTAMQSDGYQVQPATKANFEKRFMTSNPDL
ncbi:MAG: hypothetical protein AAGI14_06050 [Pseudomonadota bacterium]